MPNYYKVLLKNYYIYHFRHQTINVCYVSVNYNPTTVFHAWIFSLFSYLLNIDIVIFSKYRIEIEKVISTHL